MKQANQRTNLRFDPDPGAYVLIDSLNSDPTKFKANISGLIFNESFTGCAIFILLDQVLPKDAICYVKTNLLEYPLKAVVRWREDHEIGVSKIGLHYFD